MDARITTLAAKQHGLVSRRQLLVLGLNANTIDAAVRRCRLVRVACGVYAVPGSAPGRQRELMAAALRCGPDAYVVGEPMLALLRVHGARLSAAPVVLARPGRRLQNVPWAWRARSPSWSGQSATIDGIPSVNDVWNLLEVAASDVDDAVLERLADGLRWSGRARVVAMQSALAHHRGDHAGAARLHATGLFADGASESPPERVVAACLAHHGAVTQVEVLAGVRVDVLLPAARVVIEYQGEATHSSPAQRRRGEARAARLRAAGYVVIAVRSSDLADLDAFVARIDVVVETLRRPM